jgi:hypothetical protein
MVAGAAPTDKRHHLFDANPKEPAPIEDALIVSGMPIRRLRFRNGRAVAFPLRNRKRHSGVLYDGRCFVSSNSAPPARIHGFSRSRFHSSLSVHRVRSCGRTESRRCSTSFGRSIRISNDRGGIGSSLSVKNSLLPSLGAPGTGQKYMARLSAVISRQRSTRSCDGDSSETISTGPAKRNCSRVFAIQQTTAA